MKNCLCSVLVLSAVGIFISVCGSGCQFFAEQEERPANISLDVLQAKMNKAMDPDGVYRDSKSYVQKQMLMEKKDWEDEKNYIIEIKYKRPDKMLMTTKKDNLPDTSIIINGRNAWIVYHKDKKRVNIQGKKLAQMKMLFALGRPGSTLKEIFKNVKLTEVVIDDYPYYKLECISKYKDMAPFIIYVGQNNFLTKRIEIPPNVTSVIDKYGLYDGVIIPEQTSEFVGDSKKQYKLIMYKLNVNINDEEFLPPVFDGEEE
ncbi:MAG: hypothetical protein PHV59_01540 [Victivallales bacterium]|nr:hypothetical protein [Victivallales bacterium]